MPESFPKKQDYAYSLPEALIADRPIEPRHASRLLRLNRTEQSIKHDVFSSFPDCLSLGSLLVVNDTRVFPARLPGRRKTGGYFEVLLIEEQEDGAWRCKIKNARKLHSGELLQLCDGEIEANLLEKNEETGECLIRFANETDLPQKLEKHGFAPIPPYIHKSRKTEVQRENDLKSYQTIFATNQGAIAAPTAGFHFTQEILDALRYRNIEIVTITLHVGLGTFEPIKVDDIRQHKMHKERFIISPKAAEKINRAKEKGQKIVGIGTTTLRALESAVVEGQVQAGEKFTDIFIYPPYNFQVIDELLTNFHLPESTLLMLVSAFTGKELTFRAYREAVEKGYRFFSYGDAMLIQ